MLGWGPRFATSTGSSTAGSDPKQQVSLSRRMTTTGELKVDIHTTSAFLTTSLSCASLALSVGLLFGPEQVAKSGRCCGVSKFRDEFRASAVKSGLSVALPPVVAKAQPLISHLLYILSSRMKLTKLQEQRCRFKAPQQAGVVMVHSCGNPNHSPSTESSQHVSAELEPPSRRLLHPCTASFCHSSYKYMTSRQPCPRE